MDNANIPINLPGAKVIDVKTNERGDVFIKKRVQKFYNNYHLSS